MIKTTKNIDNFIADLKHQGYTSNTLSVYRSKIYHYQNELTNIAKLKEKLKAQDNQSICRSDINVILMYFIFTKNKKFEQEIENFKTNGSRKRLTEHNIDKRVVTLQIDIKQFEFLTTQCQELNITRAEYLLLLLDKEERKKISNFFPTFRII